MTGEAPQPGETPRHEGNPWSFSDPTPSWWRGAPDRPAPDQPATGTDAATDAATGQPASDRSAGAATGRARHPRRRAPRHGQAAAGGGTGTLEAPATTEHTGEAAEAHAAAVRDVTRHLDGGTEPPVVERHHDHADPHRYDPLRPPAGHTPRHAAATTDTITERPPATPGKPAQPAEPAGAEPAHIKPDGAKPAGAKPANAKPADAKPADAKPAGAKPADSKRGGGEPGAPEPLKPGADEPGAARHDTVEPGTAKPEADEAVPAEVKPEPDVMVLPEPSDRNRPTVPLDRGPVSGLARQTRRPHLPGEPLPRATGSPHTDARLERLENSPFWETGHEHLADPRQPDRPAHAGGRRGTRRATRGPAPALLALITLGLVAAFFAWVSAEPFWLALGHGDRGYATTTHCAGSGVTQRCTGRFAAADGGYTVSRVTLLGVGPVARVPGTVMPARMVSADSHRAYLGDPGPLLQLRWLLGFILVLFCGYTIAGVTGARRLETARARRGAVLLSLAGPALLLAGFLIAAY